jgi:hypothetical protein
MKRIRADRLGSLCACESVDPGSRGAMHARGVTPFKASYRAYRLLYACIGLSGPLRSRGRLSHLCARKGYHDGCSCYSAVRFFPRINLARPMLRDALECMDGGDLIGAGVRLREAVYRQLANLPHSSR